MVRVVPAELRLFDAALAGDEALAEALRHPVAPGWVTFTEALRPSREALAAAGGDARWGTRFFITEDPVELVGWGGFKGPPDEDGVVELGYEISDARAGRGLATAAARAMVEEAFADDSVTAVIAHARGAECLEPRAGEGGFQLRRRGRGRWGDGVALPPCTRRRGRRLALELAIAGQAAAGGTERQPAPRGKSGHRRAGWSGDRPGESRGKVPQKQTA